MSIAKALADARRLKRERQARDLAPVILLQGDPEPSRLGFTLSSEREAVIEGELFEAEAMESTKAFHTRLVAIARSRNVRIISIGDELTKVSRFNLDGTPITLN